MRVLFLVVTSFVVAGCGEDAVPAPISDVVVLPSQGQATVLHSGRYEVRVSVAPSEVRR